MRILHLEDDAGDAALIRASLAAEGIDCEIDCARTRRDFMTALVQGEYDLVLSDYSLPDFDGMSALRLTRAHFPLTPFIFVSGTIGEDLAVESLKTGAVDYVLKNHLSRLVAVVRRALREAQDRAARLRTEEELRQRNELLRQITDSVDDLIVVLDRNGRRIFASPSYSRLYGDAVAPAGADAFTDVHPDDRERIRQVFQESVKTGLGRRVEGRRIQKDGSIHHVESQRSVIRNQEGKVTHVVEVSRDVTEREQAAMKIREQAALLDQVPDAIFARDLDECITYWNKGAERLYGWSAEGALGKRTSALLRDPNVPPRDELLKTPPENGDWTGELSQVTRAGKEIIVVSRRALLRDAAGQPVAILSINTDVTEKKLLEAQFLRGQRLENLGALAGGIAHDLNNILAPVLMATDILREEIPAGPAHQLLNTVEASARRGAALVNQIVQFARGIKGDPVALHLRHLLHDVTSLVTNTFSRSIELRTEVANDLHLVMGDATQLHQVLLNLCVNARDAMPKGGILSIASANVGLDHKSIVGQNAPVSGSYVWLCVSDTGTGIPGELLEKIFEPFFTTKTHGKGTGLGLSTVASIVRNHNGFIEVRSELGKGSHFNIYLPAVAQRETPAPGALRAPPPVGRGEHVLLVDDELALLEMMRGMLEANHYKVFCAKDGAEALTLFHAHQGEIKVIVTDLMMPVMDGPTLIRAVKQAAPGVGIVCVSGLSSEAKLAELNQADVNALLRKPFSAEELLVTLRKVLG